MKKVTQPSDTGFIIRDQPKPVNVETVVEIAEVETTGAVVITTVVERVVEEPSAKSDDTTAKKSKKKFFPSQALSDDVIPYKK